MSASADPVEQPRDTATLTVPPGRDPAAVVEWLAGQLGPRLSLDTRSRLTVAVLDLVRRCSITGTGLRFTCTLEPGMPVSVVVLAAYATEGQMPAFDPGHLPPDQRSSRTARWRLDAPAPTPTGGDAAADPARRLRAALEENAASTAELRRMEAELAETNRGVVALYVELEQQEEQLRTAHRAIFTELEKALRPPPPRVPGVEVAVHYAPAQEDSPTGGDLYDWIMLPNGDLQVTIVDVMGHGVHSTRGALNIMHAMRILALEGHPLSSLIGRTAGLLEPAYPELMATVLAIRLNLETGLLHVAGGSHPPMLLAEPGSPPRYITAPGRGVGYPEPGSESIAEAQLTPGTLALLYTDGLVEGNRDVQAGMAKLAETVTEHLDRPISRLVEDVPATVQAGTTHADDTLLLALRWQPVT